MSLNDELGSLARNAEMDRMMASIPDLARAVGVYHAELRAHGFTRTEALQIVLGWQAALFAMARPPDRPDAR